MSRTTSATAPQTGKPAQAATTAQPQAKNGLCMDKVAARAYQKWIQKGCQHGNDKQDWLEAEAELMAEMTRTGGKK